MVKEGIKVHSHDTFWRRKTYPPGYLLGGYKVIRLIGEGRFGIYYLVDLDDKEYILKDIKPKALKKSGNKVIFEEKILLDIDYPSIPKIIDTIKNNDEEVYLINFGLARLVNNERYIHSVDFYYFGHLLLHFYYSSFKKTNTKSQPWYNELELSLKEVGFLKRLLGLDDEYKSIYDVEKDFWELESNYIKNNKCFYNGNIP
ncbi:hypothetical protein [Clostridium magnum]|nr:hypothetical protein [Clostridium magnum]